MAADKTTPHDDSPEIDTPTTPPPGMINMTDFAAAIGASVSAAMEKANPKKETFGAYTRRVNAGKHKLLRETMQNGARVDGNVLSNTEIDLLNALDRTGRYINRLVEVIVRDEGTEETVEIRYNNKTRDQMFELRGYIRSFTDMLQQIVEAQAAENAAEEEHQMERVTRPRPKFGDKGKAFQESRG